MIRSFDPDAAERGRLLAAQKIASEPETRKRMEDHFGFAFCRVQYPEAYRSGWSRLLDRVRTLTPW